MKSLVCVGCSLLCDDVAATLENSELRSLGLCRLGHEHLSTALAHVTFKPPDRETLKNAVEILTSAESPLLLGWSRSTNETIALGQELASLISAHLRVSACPGLSAALSNTLHPDGLELTLDDVRNKAELVVYWGTNPSESSHRHASRFAVLPRGENIPEGVESRSVGVVDIRLSESMKMANHRFILKPGEDVKLLEMLKGEVTGESPIKGSLGSVPAQEVIGFANGFKKSDFSVIFYGSGLFSSTKNTESLTALADFVQSCNMHHLPTYALPMAASTNIMGCVQARITDSFVQKLMDDQFDAALIVGEDVLVDLPGKATKKLLDLPLVYIGLPTGMTYKQAEVALPTLDNILAAQGTMTRVDMEEMPLKPFSHDANGQMSEFEMLSKLVELIRKKS